RLLRSPARPVRARARRSRPRADPRPRARERREGRGLGRLRPSQGERARGAALARRDRIGVARAAQLLPKRGAEREGHPVYSRTVHGGRTLAQSSVPMKLVLEDGRIFTGRSFGARGERVAEIVFNTSLIGYQEVLSDPSYKGQAVVFTMPVLGIYGIAPERDDESDGPKAEAIICREASKFPSNWRATISLPDYLAQKGVLGIEGIDTRALVQHLREVGAKNGVLSTEDLDDASLLKKAKSAPDMNGYDLAKVVT